MATTTRVITTTVDKKVDTRAQAVLEVLAQAPDLSQRELAQRTGLSLTKAHFVLKDLVRSELVEVRSSGSSSHRLGYVYVLTQAGRALHTRLSYAAMKSAVLKFRGILRSFEWAVAELVAAQVHEVGLLGEGPLREAVHEVIAADGRLREVELDQATTVVVCDPEAEWSYSGSARLIPLAGSRSGGGAGFTRPGD